jgi:coenzyme F420 hydrogenase subunit beta
MMKSVKDVDQANLCIGCGICEGIAPENAIKIELGCDGFYHPHVKNQDQEPWDKIKKICPGVIVNQETKLNTKQEKLWGPIAASWVGYSTDEVIRWQASSGGGITGLLQFLLEKSLVTGVIHIGKSLSNPLTNDVYLSRNREDILRNSGSRYAPVSPLISIVKILNDKKEKLAFVGKPCDVAALRAYLKLYPQFEEQIVVLITFMCAGTPSMKGTEALIKAMQVDKENVKEFWYRGRGWPGKATAVDLNLKEFSLTYNESWGSILNKHLHFRCKICPDGMGTMGDITFGDAWVEENGYPSFEEQEGKSLIIARNNKGKNLIEQAVNQGYLEVDSYSIDNLEQIQPYQAQRKKLIASRILALRLTGLFYPQFSGFYLRENSLLVSVRENINETLGTLERLSNKSKFNYFVFKLFSIFSLLIQKIGTILRYFLSKPKS